MTHLSRSDGDKMLADMAEGGSGGDYRDNEDSYDNAYDDEDDMSGSGDGTSCKSKRLNDNKLISDCSFLVLLSTDGREVPVVEPGSPDDHSRVDLGSETPTAGSSKRISFATTTLVLTSLIVIFVKLL